MELAAGGAQGTCEAPSSQDVQGQSRDRASPVPAARGRGLEGQTADLVIWRSQSQRWQNFKVWYILSLPGICMYFLSSACYDKSVKI